MQTGFAFQWPLQTQYWGYQKAAKMLPFKNNYIKEKFIHIQ